MEEIYRETWAQIGEYYSNETEFVGYNSISEIQLSMDIDQQLFLSSQ